MRPAAFTHDPAVLAELPRFRAINTANQVDLLGQVNAEFIDGKRVSSFGGLPDFVRATTYSGEARSIIALRSTARRATVSRIVPTLGASVSLTAELADVVVTEHGVAELRGRDEAQRRAAMIAIAAPQFQEELRGAPLR
jgi:acyl-CoA hydrolase